MNSVQDTYVLSNGIKIPCIGFGTFKLSDDEHTVDIVKTAIDCGYRHIDTAFTYKNDNSVGKAIRECGLKRNELFVTSKLSNQNHGYENTLREFNETMNNMGIGYLDLYLIHWPKPLIFRENWKEVNEGTWTAFEELYNSGKVKAIGVSNFLDTHIDAILETATIAPMVDQLELHPQFVQRETVNYCKDHRMIVEAWSPLIKGNLNHPLLMGIAKKYNKTTAQLVLGWSIQHGFLPLPKASSVERMKENMDIFDFEITAEDIETIKELEVLGRTGPHPDNIEF